MFLNTYTGSLPKFPDPNGPQPTPVKWTIKSWIELSIEFEYLPNKLPSLKCEKTKIINFKEKY